MAMLNTLITRGKLLFDVSLSRYNTWGVGGSAQCVFHPADLDDLSDFLTNIDSVTSVTWLGLGSNVLIRDGGIDGVVIVTQSGLKEIRYLKHGVYAQAGVACAKLARATVSKGLVGIEFMAGIPGTVGGALAMNAGAFGGQTWENATEIDVINRQGEVSTRAVSEYEYGYRYVESPEGEWFVGASFTLLPKDRSNKIISIKELLAQRSEMQPIGKKNCGSVFKNPENGSAASLIEQCGLKGFRSGGACVSTKHANFIINEQQASAEDIEKLIEHIQQTVREQCEINLIPEVRTLGNRNTL